MSRQVRIEGEGHAGVSGLLSEASSPHGLLVLGHGAGAPMTHPFMATLAESLVERGVSVMRYNFSYMEEGRKRPDHRSRLLAVLRSALASGAEAADGLPLFAGGKSMGGRMTSNLVAEEGRAGLTGLVFFGFPLHAPGRKESERGKHLSQVPCPMLFHQGTRDRLADLELLRPVVSGLEGRATLNVIEGGDHSLKVPKRSGLTHEQVLEDVAQVTAEWMRQVER